MAKTTTPPTDTITIAGQDTEIPGGSTLTFIGYSGAGGGPFTTLGSTVTASDGSFNFTTTVPDPTGTNLQWIEAIEPNGEALIFAPNSTLDSSQLGGFFTATETTTYNPGQTIQTNNGGGNTHPGSVNNGGGNLHPGSGGQGNLGNLSPTGHTLIPVTS